MKILVDLKSVDNIDKYNADGFIVSTIEYSCHNDYCFSLDEISKISNYCSSYNKILIVNIDRIIEQDELDLIKKYIDELLKINVDYFIYGDMAIYAYFKLKGLENKLIYDPKTLITNSHEAEFFKKLNNLVFINNELTLDELVEISKVGNCLMEVYGFHQMFYSRRSLIRNYVVFANSDDDLVGKKLIIKEEKREEEYPIFESLNGTFVYTPFIYNLFEELEQLTTLKMIRINSSFLEEDKVFQVLDLYNKLINNFSLKEELKIQLEQIDNRLGKGFLSKKSVILKEGVK